MDEQALIAAARQGDLEAFNQLVLVYQDLVYHQAYRLMGDSDSAEDMTQEAFIRAFEKLPSYRGDGFRAWLMRLAANLCYDELRRRKRATLLSLEPVGSDGEEMEATWTRDDELLPEAAAEQKELRSFLDRHLDELSPRAREVLVLVDAIGMDYIEAAQTLGVPVGTVKSRLARARTELRGRLMMNTQQLAAHYVPAAIPCM